MAGIMIVMTTFLMVYFLKETTLTPGTLAQSTVSSGTVDLLLVSALFESFVVGLVAGKMGEGALSDGFKHSMVLVIISVVTVYVAALFIKIPL
jgi:flagellar protein FlaJ